MSARVIGVLLVFGLFAALVAGSVASNNPQPPAAPPKAECLVMGKPGRLFAGVSGGFDCKLIDPNHTCADDWRQCVNATDLANNNSQRRSAKADCEIAAEEQAKYGTPKWPWVPFGTFYPDESIAGGTVTLIDTRAQFQNGFGAMVHVTVECLYDLKAEKVINVNIEER